MNDVPSITAVEAPPPVPFAAAIFGRDEQGKAHASRFEPADAAPAEQAAGLMGMRVLRLETAEQQGLGAKLAAGRIFATGRALVPFVRGEIFAQLDADPAAFSPDRPADADVPPTAPRRPKGGQSGRPGVQAAAGDQEGVGEALALPTDRVAIKVGHRVLAAELNDSETWYLAEVTALKGPDMLQLRWAAEQYANEPLFVRHREHLALLPVALDTTGR